MSEYIRKRVIKNLIEELGDMNASQLELIGHKVVELIEGRQLVHHGLNKDHKPVGHTVDSFTQDFSVAVECSTEEKYFLDSSGSKEEGRFDKIEKDIKHAVSMAGAMPIETIYLVSRDLEPASFRGKFNKSDLALEHGGKLKFLDARELANNIFDQSQKSPLAADFFRSYLPDFAQNLDNYEYYGRIPPACTNHQSEPLFLNAIRRHFSGDHHVCVLYGLSGAGKTQAAIDYVHSELASYGNYLWISGADWNKDQPLTAVKRVRGGVAINVAGLFNSSKMILVIDDLPRGFVLNDLAELEPGFKLGGRVLVTSQSGELGSPIHLPIPQMALETAYRILGEDGSSATDECQRFVRACRFSPAILSITRSMAEVEGVDKEDLYRDILLLPASAHEEDGRPVMERILQRLSDQNRNALRSIALSGCTSYDSRFLSRFIGTTARVALQRLALVYRTDASSTLRVHDLVSRSIVESGPTDAGVAALGNAVEAYVKENAGEMLPPVLRQIHLSAHQLRTTDEERGARNPDWLKYAILQIDRIGLSEGLEELLASEVDTRLSIDHLLCVVDVRERHSYEIPKEERPSYYKLCAKDYGNLAAATDDPEIRAEMLHHQGKALRRSGEVEAALDCFRKLLADKPEWHATYGQIAHVGSQKEATQAMQQEGQDALRVLFVEMLKDSGALPLRVSLAAISRLRSYPDLAKELGSNEENVKKLAEIVALSALEGFDQFYEAFLALTSVFIYQHPVPCLGLADDFPDMLAIEPGSVDERQWQNVCEGLINISKSAGFAKKQDLASKVRFAALSFASALTERAEDNQYLARLLAKTFLALDMPNDAIQAVKRVPEEVRDHWLVYQQSKVETALGSTEDALKSAQRALALALGDPKAQFRLAAYHDSVASSLAAVGRIPEAITSLESAVALADGKYKSSLEQRLRRLKA